MGVKYLASGAFFWGGLCFAVLSDEILSFFSGSRTGRIFLSVRDGQLERLRLSNWLFLVSCQIISHSGGALDEIFQCAVKCSDALECVFISSVKTAARFEFPLNAARR